MSGREKKDEGRGMKDEGALPSAAVMARALAEGIDRLHAERGALVLEAKALREAGEREAYARTWESATELTRQIEQAEKDLEEMGGRAAVLAGGAWHDPSAKDYPDADVSVVALCTHPDDDGPVIKRMFLGETCGWMNAETDRVSRYRVIGWMTDEEAVAILKRGVRKEVARG